MLSGFGLKWQSNQLKQTIVNYLISIFVYQKEPYGRLAKSGIENIVKNIMSRTSDMNVHVTPHIFRHTTATTALDRGMNIADVSKLLGHKSIATTMEYITTNLNSIKEEHKTCIV